MHSTNFTVSVETIKQNDAGLIMLVSRVSDQVTRRLLDLEEQAVKEALIARGWIPPEKSGIIAAPQPQKEQPEALRDALAAEQAAAGQEPVAHRYKDARGHWRYVGAPLTKGWDFPKNLNHEPLYAAPQPAVAAGREQSLPGHTMTDTIKTPTDAELVAFATAEQFLLFCDPDEFVDIARTVLAKWGQPQAVSRGIPSR